MADPFATAPAQPVQSNRWPQPWAVRLPGATPATSVTRAPFQIGLDDPQSLKKVARVMINSD